ALPHNGLIALDGRAAGFGGKHGRGPQGRAQRVSCQSKTFLKRSAASIDLRAVRKREALRVPTPTVELGTKRIDHAMHAIWFWWMWSRVVLGMALGILVARGFRGVPWLRPAPVGLRLFRPIRQRDWGLPTSPPGRDRYSPPPWEVPNSGPRWRPAARGN